MPIDIIDAIRGWTTGGIGENYGDGFDACSKHNFMTQIKFVVGSSINSLMPWLVLSKPAVLW